MQGSTAKQQTETAELDAYIKNVCAFSRCKPEDLYTRTTKENVVIAKRRVFVFCHTKFGWSAARIAGRFDASPTSVEKVLYRHNKSAA